MKNNKKSWTWVKEKYLKFFQMDEYSENMSRDIDFGYWLINEVLQESERQTKDYISLEDILRDMIEDAESEQQIKN